MAATPKPVRKMTKKIAVETRKHVKTQEPAKMKIEKTRRLEHAKASGDKKGMKFIKSQY